MGHIWLRAETKPFEKRTILLPLHAAHLIESGHKVTVEKSEQRIFSNEEYAAGGCHLVEPGSWVKASKETYVLGIKALPELSTPIQQTHLYFAHVYKGQEGAAATLARFYRGGGTLLDLEYLLDFRRSQLVTKSAGFWAGICGAAVSLLIWIQKNEGIIPPFKVPEFYDQYGHLLEDLKKSIPDHPKILIIGPDGMTGLGARSLLKKLSIEVTGWRRKDTKKRKSPFLDILDYDILLNCIMLEKTTPLFLDKQSLEKNQRLSVIGDVSCDPDNPKNPLPIYNKSTNFSEPTIRVGPDRHPIDIMAIDNVTTFLPRESSIGLSEQLFPYLCELLIVGNDLKYTPWEVAIGNFMKHKR